MSRAVSSIAVALVLAGTGSAVLTWIAAPGGAYYVLGLLATGIATLQVLAPGKGLRLPIRSARERQVHQSYRLGSSRTAIPTRVLVPIVVSYAMLASIGFAVRMALAFLLFVETGDAAPVIAFLVLALLANEWEWQVAGALGALPRRWAVAAMTATSAVLLIGLAWTVRDDVSVVPVLVLGFASLLFGSGARVLACTAMNELPMTRQLNFRRGRHFRCGLAIGQAAALIAVALLIGWIGAAAALTGAAALLSVTTVAASALSSWRAPDWRWRPRWSEGYGRVRAGSRVLATDLKLRRLLTLHCSLSLLFAIVTATQIFYAQDAVGTTTVGYAVLVACWVTGGAIGNLVPREFSGLRVLFVLAAVTSGLAFFALVYVSGILAACVALGVAGLSSAVVQHAALELPVMMRPERYYDVSAAVSLIGGSAAVVGFVCSGVLVEVGSAKSVFEVVAIGMVVVAFMFPRQPPTIRSAVERRQGPDVAGAWRPGPPSHFSPRSH